MTGIDYGNGMTNIDHETGIRYGVIHSNHLMPEAVEDIYQSGDDLGYLAWKSELAERLKSAAADVLADYGIEPDEIDGDELAESFDIEYMNDEPSHYRYESDGYILELMRDGDIFVIKSPYVTRRGFCSPCAPGACHLESEGDVLCYCLGEDWFDEFNPCPYQVLPVVDHLEA